MPLLHACPSTAQLAVSSILLPPLRHQAGPTHDQQSLDVSRYSTITVQHNPPDLTLGLDKAVELGCCEVAHRHVQGGPSGVEVAAVCDCAVAI